MTEIVNTKGPPEKVEDLICFALYSATHAMNRAYKPHLSALGLTYPQYIVLTSLWQNDGATVGDLCDQLMMETSTITPILKRLEHMGHLDRRRGKEDERKVFIHLSRSGLKLKEQAPDITTCIIDETGLPPDSLDKLVSQIGQLRANLIGERDNR